MRGHMGDASFGRHPVHVNAKSGSVASHLLHRSSVQRMYKKLPPELRHSPSSNEVLLLDFIQQDQATQRAKQMNGSTLLTAVEEELMVLWMQRELNMNAPITPEEAKDHARTIIAARVGGEYDGSLRGWYTCFLDRYPELSV